jgi:anaerobic magnesium-protoporphyrin IX monomethyl ester cyclase
MERRVRKVLLIVPPCFTGRELDFEIGFPVHLALLGRVAQQAGWDVDYLDMTLEEKEGHDSFNTLTLKLWGELAVVGISNHTVRTSVTTKEVAERVKSARPDVKVVVGGVNSTFMWRELLEDCPAIDYILRGYAQPGLLQLLKCVEADAPVKAPGLATRVTGGFHAEPLATVTPADFAIPALDQLEVSRYLEWTQTYPILTHTGCGFSCNFCTSVMPGPYQNLEVHRASSDVVAEMKQAMDAGFERFFFSDNIFSSRRDRSLDLCAAMSDAGIQNRATWVCMTRVEFVDEELLHAMSSSGCINVAFGVETAGARGWADLRKGRFSEDTIQKAFRLTKAAGIGTTAYLMLGAPYQTMEDIDGTVELVRELNPDYRVVSFFQPFPGTPYWTDPQKYGLSDIAPLEKWNFHEGPICRTALLSKPDLLDAAIRLYLDRAPARPQGIDVHRDALMLRVDASAIGGLPDAVSDVFALCDGSMSISETLRLCHLRHGSRGRLIALYWLSSTLADETMAVVSVYSRKEVRDYASAPR